jgi:hypothetical protein
MNKENNWFMQVAIFLLWALSSVLSFWTILVAHQSFQVSIANLYVQDDIVRGWQARFFDKVFIIIAGLIWLIAVFFIEGYFRDGIAKHDVWRRAARVFGIELIIFFIFNLITALAIGSAGGTLGILMLIGECVLGGGLYAFSVIAKPKGHIKRT